MKFILGLLLLISSNLFAANVYVSSTGSDTNAGTIGAPYQTITRVNAIQGSLLPGDSILFKRGDTIRGGLVITRSDIVLGSYGTGAKPCIWGSKNFKLSSQWVNVSGNIWKVNTIIGAATNTIFPKKDIANVIFNGATSCGVKKPTYGGIAAQGDFYYSSSGDSLYLFSTSNPGLFYTDIEVGGVQSQYVIRLISVNNFAITDLDIRYSGNDAVFMNNSNGVVVKNCNISWAGGLYFDAANVRMGNGIQIWEQNANIEVTGNTISQIYDAGVSPQGNAVGYTQSNINIHHNTIDKTYYSYELFIRSPNTFSNIVFENNNCIDAGRQWSQTQRTDSSDAQHIRQVVSTGSYSGLKIRYNTFNGSTVRYAQMDCSTFGMECDYNTIINSTSVFGRFEGINLSTIQDWRAASSFDTHSNISTKNYFTKQRKLN